MPPESVEYSVKELFSDVKADISSMREDLRKFLMNYNQEATETRMRLTAVEKEQVNLRGDLVDRKSGRRLFWTSIISAVICFIGSIIAVVVH